MLSGTETPKLSAKPQFNLTSHLNIFKFMNESNAESEPFPLLNTLWQLFEGEKRLEEFRVNSEDPNKNSNVQRIPIDIVQSHKEPLVFR